MTQEEKAKAYDEALERARKMLNMILDNELLGFPDQIREIFPQLRESEDEMIRKLLVWQVHRNIEDETNDLAQSVYDGIKGHDPDIEESIEDWKRCLAWLEKQKENSKSCDSIPSNCASDAKCEDRWHKVSDSLPDNGRLVLANDCLGNTLLARYDGEGNWEVSVYDNEDYYCRNTITKWCEIPSEKQKEQKRPTLDDPDLYGDWDNDLLEEIHSWLGHLDGKYTPYTIDDIKLTARHFVEWQKQKEQKTADLSDMMVHKEPYIAPVPTPMVVDEQKPAEYIPDSVKFSEGYKTGREVGFREGVESVKPAEWSEEDEDMLNCCISSIEEAQENRYAYKETDGDTSYDREIAWLKSLRPQYHGDVTMTEAYKMGLEAGKASSWKPSEHQMDILKAVKDYVGKGSGYWGEGLGSLIDDLEKLM